MNDSAINEQPEAPHDVAVTDPLQDQPLARVERDGVEYVLLGTAHVSRASVEAVKALVEREPFDAIAVELCESRARGIRDPEAFAKMDLFQVIRTGKAGMVFASLALSSFQQRIAEQYGIEPGAEMKAAMREAEARNVPLWLVDREIGTTLNHAYRGVRFRDRLGIIGGLIASVFSSDEIDEAEIEKLKQGDILEGAFGEFARESKPLYEALIGERDRFMAARLREESSVAPAVKRVLVVIGAGHLAGIQRELDAQQEAPRAIIEPLAAKLPAPKWPKYLTIGIMLAIFAAIGFLFYRNATMGWHALRDWVIYTAALSGIGAAVAGGHPLSVLTAAVMGPLKPLRPPGLSSGVFSGMVEAWLRKPRVADFQSLRKDLLHISGWWRNRVARTLLVFMLTNLGTIAGEYLAGIRIFSRLL
ncbi:MAG TPA: TraB/GumN family protein [Rhodanobacteraceae bacterium]|nr:TraB/GumN family protein [Rhodanobacteraceae bacterium]